MILAIWLAAIIYVEALTELIRTAEVFILRVPREWLMKKFLFFRELFVCGYCFSIWSAATVFWALPPILSPVSFAPDWLILVVDGLLRLLVLHRLSNVWHEFISRWLKRIPWQLVLTKFDPPTQEAEKKEPTRGV